ncbi:hypothetical protein Esi_0138_0024 [Ectocarpus siliculosus]|uniref:Uncharacterized protein n=1 Tax=Ectocarpus siliculosus TaxID=2880 RepID=D7FJV4_ECTSI|nr:hypothetical protein Esi_0138_0024 [Ectocarpus siliculosus]|eukprot:CBJ29202.1 hypothetical protein Esi_0138_0024 [Ectocarpus siliculosus]
MGFLGILLFFGTASLTFTSAVDNDSLFRDLADDGREIIKAAVVAIVATVGGAIVTIVAVAAMGMAVVAIVLVVVVVAIVKVVPAATDVVMVSLPSPARMASSKTGIAARKRAEWAGAVA